MPEVVTRRYLCGLSPLVTGLGELEDRSSRHKPVRSGDAVRTRMNSGVSPLLYRAERLDPEAVRTRQNSGSSPHHRFSPVLDHEPGIAARRPAATGVPFLHERR